MSEEVRFVQTRINFPIFPATSIWQWPFPRSDNQGSWSTCAKWVPCFKPYLRWDLQFVDSTWFTCAHGLMT
jgi:hypothetical protein